MNFDDLMVCLVNEEYYKILFCKVYGDEFVIKECLFSVIEEFVNVFVFINLCFDEGMNFVGI